MPSCSSFTRILRGNCSSLSSSSMRSSCTTHKCMLLFCPSDCFWVVSGRLFLFCLLLSRSNSASMIQNLQTLGNLLFSPLSQSHLRSCRNQQSCWFFLLCQVEASYTWSKATSCLPCGFPWNLRKAGQPIDMLRHDKQQHHIHHVPRTSSESHDMQRQHFPVEYNQNHNMFDNVRPAFCSQGLIDRCLATQL